ncbi:MAG: type II toxin-antitoxin system HicA family toxin [Patescibacteria group bacterium]
MPKLPSFKPREIEKVLSKNGFYIKRQVGSHRTYYNPKTNKITIVPFHSRDLPKGTVRSIIKQSGLEEKIFRK